MSDYQRGLRQGSKSMVCRLLKTLYGLKQLPRLWYERFSIFLLEKLDLSRIHAHHSIFMLTGLNGQVVSVFVDDIEIKGMKGSDVINKVKAELITAFSMVDIGPISFYLGLNVERDREKRIIKPSTGLHWENSLQIPFWSSQSLQHSDERIGNASTPNWDIAFSTAVVSQFIKNPSHQHIEAVKTISKYLKGSKLQGITYGGKEELKIQAYSDSDWAGDKECRKSTSGYIFMLSGRPVSWCCKRQCNVVLSLTEAE